MQTACELFIAKQLAHYILQTVWPIVTLKQTHGLHKEWEVGNRQSTMYSLHPNISNHTKQECAHMIYGYVLFELKSMIFPPISHTQNGVDLSQKSTFPPSEKKKIIHLFHTYSSSRILLRLPKAFRDAQHSMPELV